MKERIREIVRGSIKRITGDVKTQEETARTGANGMSGFGTQTYTLRIKGSLDLRFVSGYKDKFHPRKN